MSVYNLSGMWLGRRRNRRTLRTVAEERIERRLRMCSASVAVCGFCIGAGHNVIIVVKRRL